MAGRSFEQWKVATISSMTSSRTVTETDNLLVTTQTHNSQPLHLDAEYAAGTELAGSSSMGFSPLR